MNKFKAFIWGGMSVSLLLAGCAKELSDGGTGKGAGDFFDFRTANTQVVNVEYDLPGVFFEAYSENPVDTVTGAKKVLTPLFRGITDENGKYSETVQLPTYVSEVYLYSVNIGVPNVTRMSLESVKSRAAYRVDDAYLYSGCANDYLIMGESAKWNAVGVPNYLDAKVTVATDELKMLESTLGNRDEHTSKYIAKSGEVNLDVIKDGATIDIVILYNGGNTRTNTLGYYYYLTGTTPAKTDIKKIILLPNATFAKSGGLELGDKVRLKYFDGQTWSDAFPAGVTVGWFFVSGGYDIQSHEVMASGSGRAIGYSNTEWSSVENRSHNVIVRDPRASVNRRYMCVEDQNFESVPTYRDFIFRIDVDGVEFNDARIPDGKDMTDSDKDGVPDTDDEFPEDPGRAYSMNYIGSVSFEDIWPYKGDYDMNDLSISYNSTHYLDGFNRITRITEKWTVKNAGAQLENGFGYQYEMQNFKVTTGLGKLTITSDHPKSSFVETNSIEKGQTKATIILFDNAKEVMSAAVETRTFTVDLILSGPTKVEGIGLPPYNPFIIVNTKSNGRGHEVHLPNYKPTVLMDTKLLGFGHDLSEPEKEIYYVSDQNFPFAIHLIGVESIKSIEGQGINKTYPDFTKWVSSKGMENKDWFLHPAQ